MLRNSLHFSGESGGGDMHADVHWRLGDSKDFLDDFLVEVSNAFV
jgi:hypothetical protein